MYNYVDIFVLNKHPIKFDEVECGDIENTAKDDASFLPLQLLVVLLHLALYLLDGLLPVLQLVGDDLFLDVVEVDE